MGFELPDVRMGDIWEDCDPRTPRRLQVIGLPPGHVKFANVKSGKVTEIQRMRCRPTSTGYRLVERTAGQKRDSA